MGNISGLAATGKYVTRNPSSISMPADDIIKEETSFEICGASTI